MIKFELSIEIRILENFICRFELDSLPTLNEFSDEIDGDIEKLGF